MMKQLTDHSYSFAAGVIHNNASKDEREYRLFRTYVSKSKSREVGGYRRDGPAPATCTIAEACAATGAAQYFLKPFKIRGTSYFDADFPHPHKISSLALDEAYSLFGENAALSLMLNVGPSIASDTDIGHLRESTTGRVSRLTRMFSWPKSGNRSQSNAGLTKDNVRIVGESRAPPSRSDTSSSLAASDTEKALQMNIRDRLEKDYRQNGKSVYYHIGPVESVAKDSLSLNDVAAMDLSNEEVDQFRSSHASRELIEQAARQYVSLAA
jgi:hypothetical protein